MSNWSYTRVGAKDGKGIQNITEYYKLSANTTETFSASTISTWSTSVSQPTSAKPYLLNAELVVYSDGTKEYKAPHVASRYVTDGQAGRGIAGITEYYLATSESSNVTRSTSGWTTTIQTMTSTKKYLWNYEKTTYTDDSDPSYTNPCIIGVYGDKGDKGDQGNPGTAAKFVEIEAASGLVFKNGSPSQLPLKCIATGFTASSYQWYKDGTAISGATSQTYNATTAGVYKVTANGYSDIATVISVSDGADGNDGRGISSTEIKYATSTSNTTAPSSGWQSTVPAVAQGSYLWTRTTIKYTSGSDSVSYTVARQGSNGTNGSNGTSVTISSKSVKYQAGTSGTTAPSGTWSDTVPSVTKGQYLWTKTEVTYSDGNSTTSYSVGYAGTNGTNGTSPYACSVSNENFTVATGTDLKPLSATTYSVKFTAYKGSTQLSAIAPSATIASGKFKVSTPTATGFTVAQSTNGTLTFTTATGTAISANLSVNVTVTYDNGSTETKTITISASKTGAKGATGTSSYSYVRYSANADGTDFTTTPSSATKYVGFYSGTSSTAPTDKASYTWTKFVGEDGANGTSLTSKGNWASGTAYKVSEVVYYATNKTSYVCKKAHTSSSSILPTNTTYWTVLAAPGTDGQDATQYYMHFVYCDDTSSGTNYSTTESRKYVGIYTDTTQADAATFSAANAKSGIIWSKAEGDDGTSPTVSSTAVTYQQADSGTSVPTGTWNATPPTATAGKYMWTKTVVTYSDSATSTSYAVSKNGSNGTNGTSPWTVTCSEPAVVLACGGEKTVSSEKSITIKFNAFQGATRKAATIATSTLPSGVSVTSNTAATTSADGSLVLKIAAGANLGGTTAAYNTVIITLTVTANSVAYTFSLTLSKQISGQWQTAGWLDLTASTYDTNTWYPVTGTAMPKNPQKFQVSVRGDGQTNIPWSSHGTGKIGVEFCVEDVGIAWGWLPSNQCTIFSDTFAQTKAVTGCPNQSPVSYTQMSNSSTPVIWLRGGAKYYVEATYAVTWTIRTEATTISSQTVTPSANARPTPRGVFVRGKGVSTVAEYYKLSANTTETFDSTTINNWSTNPSTLIPTASTPYLLNAERITLTDGVNTTYEYKAPHICLTYQEDGANGRGITSITNVYKLTTNTTKPTAPTATDSVWDGSATGSTSVWGTVCPTTTTTNKYLWNCERIKYDDDTYTVTPVALLSTHGATGTRGTVWYSGTGITGTSTTATVFSNSGVTSAIVGDMYKNTDTSNTYRCTTAGNASTAKWVYTGTIKGDRGFSSRTIAFRANYSAFSSPNVGEVYVCGYDSNGAEADTAGYVIVNGVTYYSKGMLNSNAAMDGYIIIPKTSTSSSSPSRPEYAYYSGSGWYKIANDLTSGNVTATAITDTDYIALAKIHAYSAEGIVTVTPITHCLLSSITQPIDLYYEGIVATVTQYTNASITPYKITRSGDGYTKTAITARNARRGAVVFDTRAATPTASTAAPTIRFYNGTYWNEISSSNALYSKAVAIMAGDLLGIAGYYRTKELPIPSICGTYMETMYCNLALIENLFSQQATIDELQSLSLLFSEYCGSVNSQNPSVGDMMIYMGKNPRLTAATREFRFAISQYLGKIGGQEMWSDKLVTKFLAGGLLALNLMGCVQTTDAVYSKVGESNTWKEVDLDGSDTSPIYSVSGDSINGLFAVIKYDGSIFITKDFESYTRSNSLKNMLTDENLVDVAVVHGSNQTCLILTNKKLFKTHDYQTFQNISPWQSAASTGNIINFWRKKNTLFVCRNNVLFLTSANDENFSQWQTVSLSESPSEILCVDDCLVAVEQNKIELIKKTENGFAIEEYDNYFSDVDIGSFFLLSKDNLIVAVGTSGIAICKKDYSGIESVKNYPTTSFGGMWANKVFYNNKLFCCMSAPGDTTFALYSIDFSSDTPSVEKKLDFPSGSYGAFFVGVCGDLVWTCFTGTPVYISTDGGNTFSQKIDPPNNTAYFRGMSYISELNLYMGSWTYSSDSSTHFFVSRGREAGSGIIAENFSPNMGYVVWSNGLIIQWGTCPSGGSLTTKKRFPIDFPNYVACITFLPNNSVGTSEGFQYVYSYDKQGFIPALKWMSDYTVGVLQRDTKYVAIGY